MLRHTAVATLDRGWAPELVVVVGPRGRLPEVGGDAPAEAHRALDVHRGLRDGWAGAGDDTMEAPMADDRGIVHAVAGRRAAPAPSVALVT